MTDHDRLAAEFETHRPRLRAVAYRMLGSLGEAEDAVQEAWLRLSRSDAATIDNLGGWLTTVVGRVCLDTLRSRKLRGEESLDAHVPDPVVTAEDVIDPEQDVLMADAIGLALLVVLETLTPAERLAFVLHDMFGLPFDDIAPIVGRSPMASRQLASRARRRVQGAAPAPDSDRSTQRAVVDAFVAASSTGNFEALLTVLDPDVVMRVDRGAIPQGASKTLRGAAAVIDQGFRFSGEGWQARPAQVNGSAGVVVTRHGQAFAVIGFTVRAGRIAAIDILGDPARVRALDLGFLR